MFKFLKKKLFGVEKKLEEAIEDQIEQELAKSKQEPTKDSPAKPADPLPPQQPAEPSAPTSPAPRPAQSEPRSAPVPTPEAVKDHEEPKQAAEPEPKPEPAASPSTPAPSAPLRPETGYRAAKRAGQLEDEERRRKKEAVTVDQRIEAELQQAVETQRAIDTVVGEEDQRIILPEDQLEDLLWELELGLLESDVAMPVIEAIKSSVREQLTVTGVRRGKAGQIVEEVLRTAIRQVLEKERVDFDQFIVNKLKEKRPVVIMFVGVNGTGKTTSIAKIAYRLKQNGISSVLAAGDTFRAGAIEQLSLHGENIGVKVVKHGQGSDPAAVAYDAIEHAKSRHKDVVLLDTAGRMQTNKNLMDEMAKIRRVARPDMAIFVGDALAGNDAVEQAKQFNEVVGLDGVILTKVDADAKGGAALSVAFTIGKPLLFIGVGQEYEQQVPFDAKWMVERLFGDDGEEATVAA